MGSALWSQLGVWYVRLPHRASPRNIQVDSPYEVSRGPDELHHTYLDTFGRPVIVAHKKNLVEQHIQDIVVGTHACAPSAAAGVGAWGLGRPLPPGP